MRKQKTRIVLLLVIGLITSLTSFVVPIINANIISSLTIGKLKQVLILTSILLAINIAIRLTYYGFNYIWYLFKGTLILDIRKDLCKNLFELEVENFDRYSSGFFQERIKSDPNDITRIFGSLQLSFFDLLVDVGIIFYVCYLNVYIGLLYVLVIIILSLIQDRRLKVWSKNRKEIKVINEENGTLLNEMMRGIREIKVLNMKVPFINHTVDNLYRNYRKSIEMDRNSEKYWNIYYITKEIFGLLIIILGIYLIFVQKLTTTGFLVIYMYRNQLFSFTHEFSNLKECLKDFSISSERIFSIMNSDKYKKEQFGTVEIPRIKGEIEFRHVTFGYHEGEDIIKDFSLKINPNETIALIGKSGQGKTTIFNLLTRMYDIKSGEILIDGVNIKDLTEDSLRNNMSIINQNPYIFHMSIRENLILAKPDATEEEMIKACEMACLHDFIMTLENGYDSIIGEGGVNLSGGEKQRLAIARALLQDTEIILMDEATSALDNQTQTEIQESIKNISKDYTIIIVAHRLSTIVDSDRIVVLDGGVIKEEGTHQELMKSSTIYKNLYRSEG